MSRYLMHCAGPNGRAVATMAAFAGVLGYGAESKAAEANPPSVQRSAHRLSGALDVATGVFLYSPGSDDGLITESGNGLGVSARYAYAIQPEFGVQADYRVAPDIPRHVFEGSLVVRPHARVGKDTELGLVLRLGAMGILVPDLVQDRWYVGPNFAVGPDLRTWVSPKYAIDLGLQGRLGGGDATHDSTSMSYLALEFSVGVVLAP